MTDEEILSSNSSNDSIIYPADSDSNIEEDENIDDELDEQKKKSLRQKIRRHLETESQYQERLKKLREYYQKIRD
jgi:hypothetical protein